MKNILLTVFIIFSLSSFGQNFYYGNQGALSSKIDTSTYINFIVETSSLSTDSIEMAINTVLKDTLIEFYGTETLYNNRVTLSTAGNERMFNSSYLNKSVTLITSSNNIKIVNIVFEDECDNSYYDSPFDTTAFDFDGDDYKEDIDSLRTNTEDWRNTLRYTGVVFWVEKYYDDFDLFLDAVYNGQGVYSGVYCLNDRQEQFKFYYSEDDKMDSDSETRYYYSERIISALRDLGFDL